jgi:CheY-like chemotaxis protein
MNPAKRHILVIEDSPLLRRALRYKLLSHGYKVTEAIDGEDGIQKIETHPDLICLDLYMPNVDGIEFLRRLEKTPYHTIPILIVTVSKDKSELAASVGGANIIDVIIKSEVSLDEIVQRIDRILVPRSPKA